VQSNKSLSASIGKIFFRVGWGGGEKKEKCQTRSSTYHEDPFVTLGARESIENLAVSVEVKLRATWVCLAAKGRFEVLLRLMRKAAKKTRELEEQKSERK